MKVFFIGRDLLPDPGRYVLFVEKDGRFITFRYAADPPFLRVHISQAKTLAWGIEMMQKPWFIHPVHEFVLSLCGNFPSANSGKIGA